MALTADRKQFRRVLKEVAKCVRAQLDAPGLTPLTGEQIMSWLQNVTPEDVAAVLKEIDAEQSHSS